MSLSEEHIREIARILEQRRQEDHARRLRWGEIGPPVNIEFQGQRLVAAYNELLPIRPNATYHEFLLHFVRYIFGEEWWNDEVKKITSERHIVVQWHDETRLIMNQRSTGHNEIQEAAMPAATGKLLNLSFALHQTRHQGLLLPSLVKRLKETRQFQGAFYEAVTSAAFSRAGFRVDLEPEGKDDLKRCEFIATHKKSGRCYSVEAKSRHRPGILGQPPSWISKRQEPHVAGLIRKALAKHAEHTRVICVDVNHPQPYGEFIPEWATILEEQVNQLEQDGFGPAMLIFTNSPFHFQPPTEPASGQNSLVTGLNESSFQTKDLNILNAAMPGLLEAANSFNLAVPGRWD